MRENGPSTGVTIGAKEPCRGGADAAAFHRRPKLASRHPLSRAGGR